MTSPPSTFPDVEAIVVELLSERADLADAVVDETPPPGFDGTQKAVLDTMQTRAELYDAIGYWDYEKRLDALFAKGKEGKQ